MSSVIGRGRYARATYPQSPGAGGGAASGNPLSRQRFIDGDTTNPGPGAASAPFKTISDFIASRTNASVDDATSNYVGWLMPKSGGYSENISFPPYVATEIRADSFSSEEGTDVTGNVTWANVAPAAHAGIVASAVMHNVSVFGSFTVTDDSGAPTSLLLFGGDEAGEAGVELSGFDSHTTTKLAEAIFYNTIVNGNISAGADTPVSGSRAVVGLLDSSCNGAISAFSFAASGSSFLGPSIAVNPAGLADFVNCIFSKGTSPALTALGGAQFDGPSWRSFAEAGGTRTTDTVVLVTGGYSGAAVEGHDLPDSDASVSLNGLAGGSTFTGSDSGNHYSSNGITNNRAVTLLIGGGEEVGDTICITKLDTAAHDLVIKNNGGVTIATIQASGRGFVLAQYVAGSVNDWVFAQGGALP